MKGVLKMSTREKALCILDGLTDEQIAAFVTLFGDYKPEEPNEKTRSAIDEIENGGGKVFSGSTEDLFKSLSED